jgi:hypothetical protein
VCSSATHSLFWLRRNWVAFSWNRLAVSCTLKSPTGGNEYDPLEGRCLLQRGDAL